MGTCSGVVVFGAGELTGCELAYLAHLEGPLLLLLPELFLLSRAVLSVVGAVYCASGRRGGSCPCSSSSSWSWSVGSGPWFTVFADFHFRPCVFH